MAENIKYFARHTQLDVSAGFETEKHRNDYVALSIRNGHDWKPCSIEDIEPVHHTNHYLEESTILITL